MDLSEAIAVLGKHVPDPSKGLPDEIFYYISRTTPLVNVDLLVTDENGRTLLAWRDDAYSGKGWHVPGGIVRWRETLETRLQKVAESEIGTKVNFEATPIAVHQFIHPERENRSHFVTLLYRGFLPGTFVPQNKGLSAGDPGYLLWHASCPEIMVKCHEIYRAYLSRPADHGALS